MKSAINKFSTFAVRRQSLRKFSLKLDLSASKFLKCRFLELWLAASYLVKRQHSKSVKAIQRKASQMLRKWNFIVECKKKRRNMSDEVRSAAAHLSSLRRSIAIKKWVKNHWWTKKRRNVIELCQRRILLDIARRVWGSWAWQVRLGFYRREAEWSCKVSLYSQEVERVKNDCEDREKQICELQDERESLIERLHDLSSQLAEARRNGDVYMNRNRELKDSVERKENQFMVAKEEVEEMKNRYERLLASRNEEQSTTQSLLSEKLEEISRQRGELMEAQEESRRLKSIISDIESHMASFKSRAENAEEQLAKMAQNRDARLEEELTVSRGLRGLVDEKELELQTLRESETLKSVQLEELKENIDCIERHRERDIDSREYIIRNLKTRLTYSHSEETTIKNELKKANEACKLKEAEIRKLKYEVELLQDYREKEINDSNLPSRFDSANTEKNRPAQYEEEKDDNLTADIRNLASQVLTKIPVTSDSRSLLVKEDLTEAVVREMPVLVGGERTITLDDIHTKFAALEERLNALQPEQ